MANRRAASGGECRSTSSLPTFLASSRPSLVMAARATLPRPCCRETFLVSTAGDGKSELLQKKQRRARAIWHHGGPPPPPWQQPTCCLCLHRLFSEKMEDKVGGTFDERVGRTQLLSRCVFLRRRSQISSVTGGGVAIADHCWRGNKSNADKGWWGCGKCWPVLTSGGRG